METQLGDIFARVMTKSIEREESDLRELGIGRTNPKIDTVHYYYEPWLWPAFNKEALRDSSCPNLAWEQGGRADCCFLGDNEKTIATFELKPFFPTKPLKAKSKGDIIDDFEKQSKRAKVTPQIEHYVALIPYGDVKSVADMEEIILQTLAKECPNARVNEVKPQNPVALNRKEDGFAFVKVFRVTS